MGLCCPDYPQTHLIKNDLNFHFCFHLLLCGTQEYACLCVHVESLGTPCLHVEALGTACLCVHVEFLGIACLHVHVEAPGTLNEELAILPGWTSLLASKIHFL